MSDLVIDHIGARGDGIAYQGDDTIYIPRTARGDVVQAKIKKDRDGTARGQLTKIVQSSSDRQTAPCVHYDWCGGCQLQHITEQTYRAFKLEHITTALNRAGVTPKTLLDPVFIPPGTRRRANFVALKQGRDLKIGFHQQRSHAIVDVDECLIITPQLHAMRNKLKEFLPDILKDGVANDVFLQDIDGSYELIFTGPMGKKGEPDAVQVSHIAAMAEDLNLGRVGWRVKDFTKIETVIDRFPLIKKFGNLSVPIPRGSFLQPSKEGEAALVGGVMDALPQGAKALDLFSGCGTFTGPMLEKFKSVHAVEATPDAITALQKANAQGVSAQRRDLFRNPIIASDLNQYDAIVFDPPRAGAKEQSQQLAQSDVPVVVGVSCNPATFARDARILSDGGYALESVQAVDQFVWSAHVEVIGVFKKV